MQGEKFTLMQYNVSAILGFIEAGQFVIPEIQRPFVWKKSQVRDLIDSLYNGYPTGYIITWKNPVTILNLVAQCATEIILSLPPIFSSTSSAAFL